MLEFDPSYSQVVETERDDDEWTAELQCCAVSALVTSWLAGLGSVVFSIFPPSQRVGQNHNGSELLKRFKASGRVCYQ